jgi:tRNA (guanine-N7-)-methyltransferase
MENAKQTAGYRSLILHRKNELNEILSAILAAQRRFVWEVGCGHGHFLTAFAQAHPDRLCIGVDMESKRIERALKKRDRARLPNLHFVHGEARLFLEALPAGAVFDDIFVLFPDPWPKLRHHKHRILQPDFLTAVARRAGEGARFCFRTDYQPYFADASAAVHQHPDWAVSDEAWPFEFETVFQSRADGYHSLVARRRQPPP